MLYEMECGSSTPETARGSPRLPCGPTSTTYTPRSPSRSDTKSRWCASSHAGLPLRSAAVVTGCGVPPRVFTTQMEDGARLPKVRHHMLPFT
jgi:hypothetical protein